MRYNHWFWNSKPVVYLANKLVKFNSWVWKNQYDRIKEIDKTYKK